MLTTLIIFCTVAIVSSVSGFFLMLCDREDSCVAKALFWALVLALLGLFITVAINYEGGLT